VTAGSSGTTGAAVTARAAIAADAGLRIAASTRAVSPDASSTTVTANSAVTTIAGDRTSRTAGSSVTTDSASVTAATISTGRDRIGPCHTSRTCTTIPTITAVAIIPTVAASTAVATSGARCIGAIAVATITAVTAQSNYGTCKTVLATKARLSSTVCTAIAAGDGATIDQCETVTGNSVATISAGTRLTARAALTGIATPVR